MSSLFPSQWWYRHRSLQRSVSLICLLILQRSRLQILACEQYPCNMDICGNSLSCKKNLAGGMQCHQYEYCSGESSFHCEDADVAKRAGYVCDDFPWYNGGYPMSSLHWDNEEETYECVRIKGNSSSQQYYCAEWTSFENSVDEWETGDCVCTEESANEAYCRRWECTQVERKKCGQDYWCSDCSSFGCDFCLECQTTSDDGYTHTIRPAQERERAECTCFREAENGQHCEYWYCYEYSLDGHGAPEHEDYTCLVSEGSFCMVWDGTIDGEEEFEFSECSCQTKNSTMSVCQSWTCAEKGMNYFYPNLLWSLMSTIFGLPCAVLVFAEIYRWALDDPSSVERIQYWALLLFAGLLNMVWSSEDFDSLIDNLKFKGHSAFFYLIWAGGWNVLCIWLGGLTVLFITFAVHFGPLLLCALCVCVLALSNVRCASNRCLCSYCKDKYDDFDWWLATIDWNDSCFCCICRRCSRLLSTVKRTHSDTSKNENVGASGSDAFELPVATATPISSALDSDPNAGYAG